MEIRMSNHDIITNDILTLPDRGYKEVFGKKHFYKYIKRAV